MEVVPSSRKASHLDVALDSGRQDRRDGILAAAIEVLQHRGAAALTVRNVAHGAGCSTTGVYTYFGGKNGLVDAMFIDGFESFDRALRAAADDLREAGRAYRRWAIEHPTQYLVMFGSAVPDYVPSDAALRRALESYEILVGFAAHASPPDSSDEANHALAFHVWATVHGYVMLELQGMPPPLLTSAEDAYDQGLDHLLAVVRAGG